MPQSLNSRTLVTVAGVCLILQAMLVDCFTSQIRAHNVHNRAHSHSYSADSYEIKYYSNQIRRDVMKAVWKDSVVSLTIPASKERTYALFSSLNEHPTW